MARLKSKKRPRSSAPAATAASSANTRGESFDRKLLWVFPLFLVGLFAIYQPAWHGTVLWDDEGHITRADLRTVSGLWRIWFEPGATQQYYPLVHSTFWLLARFWGDDPLAYHLLNITLHACSAFLIVLVLRELSVPGAILAGALFAVHPVQVESVAWMTELKNVLSGALYFSAMLVYLRFDRLRRTRLYVAALSLFVLALFAKTVAATLPAGLLVIMWWRRGRIDWRRDVQPLIPFFVLGAAGGALTAWVERTYIGARGGDFALGFLERVLIAGRAIPFYIGKLLWPTDLAFFYRRWPIDPGVWWQYLFPLGVFVAIGVGWRLRTWSRAPLAILLFFIVTLSPALGFVNVYPFKYSFVADHFQYLAAAGILAALAAVAGRADLLGPPRTQAIGASVAAAVLVAPLAVLAHGQSALYRDVETLYRASLARNPSSWVAHNNLAMLSLKGESVPAEAWGHLQEALRLSPSEPIVHNNVGTALMHMRKYDQALEHHREAVRLSPGYAEAHGNVGTDLWKLGRLQEAAEAYRTALDIKGDIEQIRGNLGMVLKSLGRVQEAQTEFQRAVERAPTSVEGLSALADSLLELGRPADAAAALQRAAALTPGSAAVQGKLGYALGAAGRQQEAEVVLREAIRLDPNDAAAHDNLGNVLQQLQRMDDALEEYRRALRIAEASSGASSTPAADTRAKIHNDFGVALARLGRRDDAIAQFQQALALDPKFAAAQANLARAQAMPK